ncbi:aspartate-semialdehyde dehydrogenase [Solemya velesiana gill symbiont]|uniref:Aspartate-semialdehyde dehydrogenase n=1 Tax=Solemya velesiana gill symbiont TaxID=1918948 RepID=A0A1T2KUQ9_9GAMM|nr:aspartate-semialdehyde dehydrogenase [Solemya velesiana gill symbiont]OOZ36603.1 aspartate-semialdehyde dehydrogenase [Solemya velesiana gill symbiont]
MADRTFNVAVVGATGAVGEAMLSILAEREFPIGEIYALASSRSAGKKVEFGSKMITVQDLAEFDFTQVQIALFSAGAEVSAVYAQKAAESGAVVVDNTSYFRYQEDIPLVVPEVNPEMVGDYVSRGIIANPNCTTIQMLVAINPIHKTVGVSRINVCTYQAVSGSGRSAIEGLARETAQLMNAKPIKATVYPKQIAFNVLPQIDRFEENGYTREEMKMVWETRKIMGDESIQVNPTAVRVPVFFGHSEAVHLETREKITAEAARSLLEQAPGVTVLDQHADGEYPTPVTESSGNDATFVGRIREDISHPRGLDLWVVADNVRKGAALNSVQIAEILINDYL